MRLGAKIMDSTKKLPSMKGSGDALWFGFGTKSLPRISAETKEGIRLCAALEDYYTSERTAEIMYELVINTTAPLDTAPSQFE